MCHLVIDRQSAPMKGRQYMSTDRSINNQPDGQLPSVGKTYLSMAMVSLWGNMCTMRALSVSRLVSSWVRWTLRVSSPSWRNKIPAIMDEEEQWERSTVGEMSGGPWSCMKVEKENVISDKQVTAWLPLIQSQKIRAPQVYNYDFVGFNKCHCTVYLTLWLQK